MVSRFAIWIDHNRESVACWSQTDGNAARSSWASEFLIFYRNVLLVRPIPNNLRRGGAGHEGVRGETDTVASGNPMRECGFKG